MWHQGAVISLTLFTGLLALRGNAAHLRDVPQKVTQPDGFVLDLLASGDEYFNYLHDRDGFVVMRSPDTGEFVYAAKVAGVLVPSRWPVGRIKPESLGIQRHLKPDHMPSWLANGQPDVAALNVPYQRTDAARAASLSMINNIVVFIRFSDDPEFTTPFNAFVALYNPTGSSGSSLREYMREASYTKLDVSSSFYPSPSGNTVRVYQDPHSRSFYRRFDAVSNPEGYTPQELGYRSNALMKAALEWINLHAPVPSNLNLDTNGDGLVDLVSFVIQGLPEGWADILWPQATAVQGVTINGKQTFWANIQIEKYLDTATASHELLHILGAVDLYHYSSTGSEPYQPVGIWDVMGAYNWTPCHPSAYTKYRYLGWLTSIPTIMSSGTYTLNYLSGPNGNAYRIDSPNSATEYFVLEYRKRVGVFDGEISGSGLLVYRINSAKDGAGNGSGPPDEVYLYRPAHSSSPWGPLADAYFSSDVGRTAVSDTTDPPLLLSDGRAGRVLISQIGSADATISFRVTFEAPKADFTWAPVLPRKDEVVQFTDTTEGTPSSWAWNFGNGGTSTSRNPTYIYSTAGAYSVTLTATNAGGANTKTKSITVSAIAAPLILSFIASPPSVDAGQQATLSWTSVGGTSAAIDNGIGAVPTAGSKPVSPIHTTTYTLTVTGPGGTATRPVTVTASSPIGAVLLPSSSFRSGTNGAEYRTDVRIFNQGTAAVTVNAILYDQVTAATLSASPFRIEARNQASFDNILQSLFGKTLGNGAYGPIRFEATGPILVGASVNNVNACGFGAVSGQWLPGIAVSKALTAGVIGQLAVSANPGSGYRTNLVFVNPGSPTTRATVTVRRGGGTLLSTATIGPLSANGFQQVGLDSLPGVAGVTDTNLWLEFTSDHPVLAYATIIHNVSGDPFAVVASAEADSSAFLPSSSFRSGSNGAEYRTDVRILNPSENGVTVNGSFYDPVAAATIVASPFRIEARNQVSFDNILQSLFGRRLADGAYGPIQFQASGPIVVGASVNNVNACGSGAVSGQWLPGIPVWRALRVGVIGQLAVSSSSSSGYRTNLVFANPGASAATASVSVRRGGGGLLSTAAIGPLPANGFRQISLDSLPGVAGTTDTNLWLEFTSDHPVLAYATMIHNVSGDPFAVVASSDTSTARAPAETTYTLPGGVPLVIVRIPAGTFQMGSAPTERNHGDQETLHQVTLTHDYYMGKYEVTQSQWQAVMGTAMPTSCGSTGIGASLPTYCVSWDDLHGPAGFIEKLNALLGDTEFRLPTEAEWERAARGNTQTRFSFGDALDGDDDCGANAAANPYVWWCGNAGGTARAVGTRGANPYGLYDMHGSVAEWVEDRYGSYQATAQTNPLGPDWGPGRVFRDASWSSYLKGARSANRAYYLPDTRAGVGFRLARSVDGNDTRNAPEIGNFFSSPATIAAGGYSTLTWSSSKSSTASIDNGVGSVPLNGSLTVSPSVTTIYTLTVTGPGGTKTATTTVAVEATFTLPGGMPLVMVKIPAGAFQMGSPMSERNRSDDEMLHSVTLTADYYIGKYEVTQAQWQAVMGTNPSLFSACGGNCPVDSVTWEAISGPGGFIEKLNTLLGDVRFRLPTEAEWERAARGNSQTTFSFGDALDGPDNCGANLEANPYVWWCGTSGSTPQPAGMKYSNPYGLYDIHGNVQEWVQDRYGPYPTTAQTNPIGPETGGNRVIRGGAWYFSLSHARSASRAPLGPSGSGSPTVGFRLARSQ